MALKKTIIKKNGLPLGYHRISKVAIITNQMIDIVTSSYLNEEARRLEKNFEAGNVDITDDPIEPYVYTERVMLKYDGNIEELTGDTMKCAYGLLKKHRLEFSDAEDV